MTNFERFTALYQDFIQLTFTFVHTNNVSAIQLRFPPHPDITVGASYYIFYKKPIKKVTYLLTIPADYQFRIVSAPVWKRIGYIDRFINSLKVDVPNLFDATEALHWRYFRILKEAKEILPFNPPPGHPVAAPVVIPLSTCNLFDQTETPTPRPKPKYKTKRTRRCYFPPPPSVASFEPFPSVHSDSDEVEDFFQPDLPPPPTPTPPVPELPVPELPAPELPAPELTSTQTQTIPTAFTSTETQTTTTTSTSTATQTPRMTRYKYIKELYSDHLPALTEKQWSALASLRYRTPLAMRTYEIFSGFVIHGKRKKEDANGDQWVCGPDSLQKCAAPIYGLTLDQTKSYTNWFPDVGITTGGIHSQDQLFVNTTHIPLIVFNLGVADFKVRLECPKEDSNYVFCLEFQTSQFYLTVAAFNEYYYKNFLIPLHSTATFDLIAFIQHYHLLKEDKLPKPEDQIYRVILELVRNPYILVIRLADMHFEPLIPLDIDARIQQYPPIIPIKPEVQSIQTRAQSKKEHVVIDID